MKKRIRLSIKISSFTALMVVVSMLASFYFTRTTYIADITAWVFIFSVVSFCVGLLHTLFLDRNITVPIQQLMAYTSSLVDNDFKVPVPVQSRDEIGSLAQSIDELRLSFLDQRRSLQELNEQLDAKVEIRTRELAEALENLRQTQEELLKVEKLASIGRLAGGIAHEINNPSGIILTRTGMLLEMAREKALPEEIVEGFQVIDRQVRRISRITSDLLVFSRMSPMSAKPVNLSEILAWSFSGYSQKARELGIRMTGDIPRRVMVLGDAGGLEQVFGNLIKNALDAMEEMGEGELRRTVIEEGDRVRVLFEDTGPGIRPEILPKILDPFFTTKKVGKGTGLGLAISYGILEDLGGSLEAGNRPEGGAVFSVTLRTAAENTPGTEGILPGWKKELS